MPEMPEVETLARILRTAVVGKRISEVQLSGLSLRKPIDGLFAASLGGRAICGVARRGKYLILELEPKAFWLIHLGMSGRLLYRAAPGGMARHDHAVVRFADSTCLVYRDPRRFGLLAFYEVPGSGCIPELRSLGKDPLSGSFQSKWLGPLLQKSRQDIKSFLLDQRRIAGLGNIYVCEALFLARIHPARRCRTLTAEETVRLVRSIRAVLRLAIHNHGTSFSDFLDSNGRPGENQKYLRVFQKEKQKCIRCGSFIKRMRQGNRSTYYCPECQV